MKRKGVSPVIATVLLVGMVIALALIVFIWMRSFTQETITKFGDENIELACGKVEFQAEETLSGISVNNVGDVPIYDMRIKSFSASGQTTEQMRDYDDWPQFGLNPGDATEINYAGGGDITIIPILLGNSESGKKTFACLNQEYDL